MNCDELFGRQTARDFGSPPAFAILGQAAPKFLKQVVSVFVAMRSRILSQAVTVFGPVQHTRGKTPASATSRERTGRPFPEIPAEDRLKASLLHACRSLYPEKDE